jgi:hypothetical protein
VVLGQLPAGLTQVSLCRAERVMRVLDVTRVLMVSCPPYLHAAAIRTQIQPRVCAINAVQSSQGRRISDDPQTQSRTASKLQMGLTQMVQHECDEWSHQTGRAS